MPGQNRGTIVQPSLVQKPFDLGGDPTCLAGVRFFCLFDVIDGFFRTFFFFKNHHLRGDRLPSFGFGIFLAVFQIVFGQIPDAIGRGGEEKRANSVGKVDYGSVASEVFGHEHADRRGIRRGGIGRERHRAAKSGENGRVAPAESVNALLDVANHKTVIPADQGEDAILYLVHILIFVDVNFTVFFEKIGYNRLIFRIAQKSVSRVAHVVEIEHPAVDLLGKTTFPKHGIKAPKHFRKFRRREHLRFQLDRAFGEYLFPIAFQDRFEGVSCIFIMFRPFGSVFGCLKGWKCEIHPHCANGFPFGSVQYAKERAALIDVAGEDTCLLFDRIRIGVVVLLCFFEDSQKSGNDSNELFPNGLPRAREQKIAFRFSAEKFGTIAKQRNALRIGSEFSVKIEQKIAEIAPRGPSENMIHAIGKPIFSQATERTFSVVGGERRFISSVKFGDQTVDDFAGKRVEFFLARDTEGRRKPKPLEIRPNRLLKERVDRGNLCATEQKKLTGKTNVVRIFGKRIPESLCNAAFQFCGGGARKGNDQHLGKADRVVLVQKATNDPFGQYACFAGACRGGHQQQFPA